MDFGLFYAYSALFFVLPTIFFSDHLAVQFCFEYGSCWLERRREII